jgi:hypothetical protein
MEDHMKRKPRGHGGRRRLPEEDRLTERVTFLCLRTERERLEAVARAERKPVSQWLRDLVFRSMLEAETATESHA